MINIQLTDNSPYSFNSGVAEILQASTVPAFLKQDVNEICLCDFGGNFCDYTQVVFADLTSSDFWKNDKRSFLFRKLIAADTIEIKLFKNGIFLADITDDTYGEFFPNLAPIQPLYVYFVLDFLKVLGVSGLGVYQIKTDVTITGISETIESEVFKLETYSDESADGTVRIESSQNGNIIGSRFDFTGLNIFQSYRIRGRLSVNQSFETDNYLSGSYEKTQIQDQIVNEWTLQTRLLPSIITNQLIYTDLLANSIQLTDYNIKNHEIYRRIEVYPDSIESNSEEGFHKNPDKIYKIKFTDKVPDLIKRNF